ncbi:MAG: DUF4256 domain-containing protein [Candidatus Gracilibacteria bacterium]|nr:DUF4256 domain-containing protein [Candidatus Gracilibacteria bacterium]
MSNRLEELSPKEKIDLIAAIAQDQYAKAREIIFGQAPTVTPDVVQETQADWPTATPSLSETFSKKNADEAEHKLHPESKRLLLAALKNRFADNNKKFPELHPHIKWEEVEARLKLAPERKLWSLNEMERTGGEPDVVGLDPQTGEYIWNDCSDESPSGRRNICYDLSGQQEAEKIGSSPNGNAVDLAEQMGIEINNETEYRVLQKILKFDRNTLSWLKTPVATRRKGFALDGYRFFVVVGVFERDPSYRNDRLAFRGSLRI